MGRKAKAIDEKDQLSISLRRDEYKKEVKKLLDTAKGKDVTDKIISAIKFFNKNQGRKDRAYREDEPEKSNYKNYIQGDSKMEKSELVNFIKDNFGEPDFKTHDGPLKDASKPFLKGYICTRLDLDLDALDGDGGLQYLKGFVAANDGKVDSADLRKDRVDTGRVDELKKQRLHIGEDREDKGVEELREERTRLYDGVDEKVEEMVEDKIAEGKDRVAALREARVELFQEGGN